MRTVKLLLIAMLVQAFIPASAQKKTDKADVKWGKDMTIKEDGKFDYVIGDLDNSTYMLMGRKKDILIQRMDGLNVVWQKPVELELDKNDLAIHRIILTKTDILVFFSFYDKQEHENRLYLSTYDQAGFKLLKRFEKIASIQAPKQSSTGGFIISLSPDRSKVLVQVLPPFEKKEDIERSTMNVYDADMQLQWSQEFSLPYADVDYRVESQRVDNDGSVLVLGVKYADKKERKALKREDKSTYEYHLLVYTGDSPTPQDYAIGVPDKFLQDMTIAMGNDGDIICAGLYGNKGSFSVRGAFYLRLERATKAILHESFKEFSDDFITQYMTEKEEKKASKKADKKGEELEMPDYQLHEIILRNDGGAVLVAEQYRTYVTCPTDTKGNMQCYQHFLYNDIIVVNVDPQGTIVWASKVPKRQHTSSISGMSYSNSRSLGAGGNITVPGMLRQRQVVDLPNYSSYALEVKTDKIYLVFNDTGKNLFLKPGDKVKQFALKGKDALVVLATIDEDGNVSREALFTPDRRDVILNPTDCVQLKDDAMFIYANRNKDYRFGLIEFE